MASGRCVLCPEEGGGGVHRRKFEFRVSFAASTTNQVRARRRRRLTQDGRVDHLGEDVSPRLGQVTPDGTSRQVLVRQQSTDVDTLAFPTLAVFPHWELEDFFPQGLRLGDCDVED